MATFELEFGTIEVEVLLGIPGAPGDAGSGAPDDATYLVTTAHADLSAEVVVGATPGGELGGTWASPTVDATHSGSSHASVQAAAEATAAAALSAHEADTTAVHGIADTSALATSASVTSAISTHAGATDPHGDRAYADSLFASNDALLYKGAIDCSSNPNYPAASAGHVYKVSVAGKIGGASGTNVEVGDSLLCTVDGTSAGTQAAVGANWNIIQANLDGAVIGPASSTSGNLPTFSGTSGKLIQDSGTALSSLAPLASPALTGNPTTPTQSAGNNSTRIASTAYVDTACGLLVPKSLVDAKGDLLVGTGDNTVARLAVGTDGYVLTADSAQSAGVKWSAGGGSTPFARAVLSGTRDYCWPGAAYSGWSSTLALTSGTLFYFPMLLTEQATVAAMATEVFAAAGSSNIRMGLYNCGRDLQPTSLVFDSGSISSASTGVKSYTGYTSTLPAGLYLGVIQSDNSSVQIRATTASIMTFANSVTRGSVGGGANINRALFRVTGTYGALPGTGTAWTTSTDSSGQSHQLGLFMDFSSIG